MKIQSARRETLLAELDADGLTVDLHTQAELMAAVCHRYPLASEIVVAYDQERRDLLWKARKALILQALEMNEGRESRLWLFDQMDRRLALTDAPSSSHDD